MPLHFHDISFLNCGILSVDLGLKIDSDLANHLQSNPQLLKHGVLIPLSHDPYCQFTNDVN